MIRFLSIGTIALLALFVTGYFLSEVILDPEIPERYDWTPEHPGPECEIAKSLRESIEENIDSTWGKCRFHEDCIGVPLACPLDCYVAVNREYAGLLRQAAEAYSDLADQGNCGACMYKCNVPQGVQCMGGRCEGVWGSAQ